MVTVRPIVLIYCTIYAVFPPPPPHLQARWHLKPWKVLLWKFNLSEGSWSIAAPLDQSSPDNSVKDCRPPLLALLTLILSFNRKLVRGRAVTRWTESGTTTTREQRPSAGGVTRTTTWWRLGRVRLVCQKARRETFKIGTLEVHLLELEAFLQVCTFKENYMLYVSKF